MGHFVKLQIITNAFILQDFVFDFIFWVRFQYYVGIHNHNEVEYIPSQQLHVQS